MDVAFAMMGWVIVEVNFVCDEVLCEMMSAFERMDFDFDRV